MTGMSSARSWLFAPGDSERKMEKATASAADVVVFDLEDAVAEDGEAQGARDGLGLPEGAAGSDRARLWVRINPIQGPHALADLAAVMPARPGRHHASQAARPRRCRACSTTTYRRSRSPPGSSAGSTKVIVLVTETAESMFTTGSYAGAPRLVAMSWGAEDLATRVGASENRNADGSYDFTYELARSLCLLGAAAAGVAAIETIHGDFRDEAGLRKRAEQVRRAGYRGMLAIHPAQVDVINEAFTPTRRGAGGGAGDRRSVRRQSRRRHDRLQGRHARSPASGPRAGAAAAGGAPMTVIDRRGRAGPRPVPAAGRPHRLGPGVR